MKQSNYLSIVKASAIYDLIVTFPYAFPVLASWNLAFISTLHNKFSFSGSIPEFLPMHLFFVNLLGSLVVVWSVLRIYQPTKLLGLHDSFARFLFSFSMLYYLMLHNVTGILWFFFIPEIAWGIIQLYGYFNLSDSEN